MNEAQCLGLRVAMKIEVSSTPQMSESKGEGAHQW